MYIRWREQYQCPLMLADSEPHNECNHSQNWVMVGKAKQNKGGSEMGKYPNVRRDDNICLPLWCRMLPPTERGTLTTCRGMASYPLLEMMKMKITKKPEMTASAWGCALPRNRGDIWRNPLSVIQTTGLNGLMVPPPSKLQTAIDSIVNNKRLQ